MNKAAENIPVYVSVCVCVACMYIYMFSFLMGKYPGVGLLGHRVDECLIFRKLLNLLLGNVLFFKRGPQMKTPPSLG